ncbi:MAG: hypothetical protein HYY32_05725 [Chloroflexi bacterium]|nr:hypothetical protein [Chloroflexota bacterium]
MVTLTVFNPTGSAQAAKLQSHAPRLADLKGKTICELWNDAFEGPRTFPLIRELLKKRFPDIRFIPYSDFPIGSHKIDDAMDVDGVTNMVVARGCDAVIGGNAG